MKDNNHGFVRVAASVPKMKIADPDYNIKEILKLIDRADRADVSLLLFPEMSITGYTSADLFFQKLLLARALDGLCFLKDASKNRSPVFMVGLPIFVENRLYNAGAVIHGGKIHGLVPKTYIPNYREFYEQRWFASSRDLRIKEIDLFGDKIPIGADLLFRFPSIPGLILGVEICEDLWTPLPPSSFQALRGATVIANLSASNDLIGKDDYRRDLVIGQSGRAIAGYIYSSTGTSESTTDLIFGGHAIIAENGSVLAERDQLSQFSRESSLLISEIDLEHLESDRSRMNSFGESVNVSGQKDFRFIDINLSQPKTALLKRTVDPFPFVPAIPSERDKRAGRIFSEQAMSVVKRLEASRISHMLIGISGGLDSTLALLVSLKAAEVMGVPKKNIHAITMPGFGTSVRTKTNAQKLCEAMGVSFEEIDIKAGVSQHLKDIKHDMADTRGIVYQNAQARYRTYILMDRANQLRGLLIGTGDLSEIALGWNTYNGDHISHYNPNVSVPKTLVKYIVRWATETQVDAKTRKILEDILDTPISPELEKSKSGKISHATEEIIGPYELHDFFLYHFVRWGSSPRKILWLAKLAWSKKYNDVTLKKWLRVFIERFFGNQWKRSVATDGPKIGSVSLSPRGDWRMPSDAEAAIWLEDLE